MQDLETEMLRDIQEVNLSYLMLAQRMLREDQAKGMARLGLDEDVATLILQLSPAQMVRLSGVNTLICGFNLNDFDILSCLSRDVMGGIMQQAHTTILLLQRAVQETGLGADEGERPVALGAAS